MIFFKATVEPSRARALLSSSELHLQSSIHSTGQPPCCFSTPCTSDVAIDTCESNQILHAPLRRRSLPSHHLQFTETTDLSPLGLELTQIQVSSPSPATQSPPPEATIAQFQAATTPSLFCGEPSFDRLKPRRRLPITCPAVHLLCRASSVAHCRLSRVPRPTVDAAAYTRLCSSPPLILTGPTPASSSLHCRRSQTTASSQPPSPNLMDLPPPDFTSALTPPLHFSTEPSCYSSPLSSFSEKEREEGRKKKRRGNDN